MSSDPNAPRFNCHEAIARLYPYLDRELDAADQAAVRAHLEACGHCASLFRFEANVLTLIGDRLARTRAPGHLRARVSALTKPKPQGR
jgi:mycothiol system anti-sigma-R factor